MIVAPSLVLDFSSFAKRLFVWSFYEDQNAEGFLRSCYRYIKGDEKTPAQGLDLLYIISEELSAAPAILFVLDGLERIQKPRSDGQGFFGEIESTVIARFLRLSDNGSAAKPE